MSVNRFGGRLVERWGRNGKDRVRLLGLLDCIGFMAVVAIGYVPQFHDAQGNLFGLSIA